jgi:RHS repeat-associated protein
MESVVLNKNYLRVSTISISHRNLSATGERSIPFGDTPTLFGNAATGAIGSYYAGLEFDTATGTQYNRARHYDPQSATWLSQDPIEFYAGDANLYRYVENGPTMATDPSGLRGWEIGGLTPGQWTYATGVLFYEWGANG